MQTPLRIVGLLVVVSVTDAFLSRLASLPSASLRNVRRRVCTRMTAPILQQKEAKGPTFWEALWGIAINGSPWDYMLDMRDAGYDGVVPVNLGPLGKYNFLLSPESVKAATVEEASCLPRRFSVPLFETLELDKGLVYEQGTRHKRHKKLCIPSFEQAR